MVTAEGFESTENINPQEIKHVVDHFISHGGTLHGIRLNTPLIGKMDPAAQGNLTEMPVTLMVARDTGGAFTDTSAAGVLEVLQRLAAVINDAHEAAGMIYQVEYASDSRQRQKAGSAGRSGQSRRRTVEGHLGTVIRRQCRTDGHEQEAFPGDARSRGRC